MSNPTKKGHKAVLSYANLLIENCIALLNDKLTILLEKFQDDVCVKMYLSSSESAKKE